MGKVKSHMDDICHSFLKNELKYIDICYKHIIYLNTYING